MTELKNSLEEQIKFAVNKFLEVSEGKEIQIISHNDTDGITSATIMIQALKKLDKFFSLKIVKSLDKKFIEKLPKNKITLFLDLASGNLDQLKESKLENIFILDHHEIIQELPENITIVNPELHKKQKISGAGLTYLFCKEINPENKEFAKLAILGMIGDLMEKNIDKLNSEILDDGEIQKKRGLLIYPSTRPINRTLEFCSHPFIPGVTGDSKGVIELLREINLMPENGKYKSIIELNREEMERIVTAIMLRNPKSKQKEIIGDIFLIKLFNKLEDAREISAKINACSRFGESQVAIKFCMELSEAKKLAKEIHAKYKQHLISGIKFAVGTEKIIGNGFVIINAEENIKDTMIGTIASILSSSPIYEDGTIIITMAYYENKIKVSGRNVGRTGRNIREILNNVVEKVGGEVGGHEFAAGCNILQSKEQEFLNLLQKSFEVEIVKI